MLQIANLYGKGADKLPFDARVDFARNHLADIFDSADNPFTGSRYACMPIPAWIAYAACIISYG